MKTMGVLSIAVLAAVAAGSTADAQQHRGRGRAHVRVVGPAYYAPPYYYYGGFYRSYLYDPFYRPHVYQRDPYQTSGVRLKVRPNEAQVFVDGGLAGKVDDFDNAFQQLDLKPGRHDIEVRLDGYRTYKFRVYAAPGRTMKIEHELVRGEGTDEAKDGRS